MVPSFAMPTGFGQGPVSLRSLDYTALVQSVTMPKGFGNQDPVSLRSLDYTVLVQSVTLPKGFGNKVQ